MLLPRPEMRIATRLGLRIVGDGPILSGVPNASLAFHSAAAGAFLNPANRKYGFTRTLEIRDNAGDFIGRDNHCHSNPAVERAGHFLRRNSPTFLEQDENAWQRPAANINDGMAMFR